MGVGAPSSSGTVQQPGVSLGAGLRGQQDSGVSSVLGQKEEQGRAADMCDVNEGHSPDVGAREGCRGSGSKEGVSPLPWRGCAPVRRWEAAEGMCGGEGVAREGLGADRAEAGGGQQGPEVAGADVVPQAEGVKAGEQGGFWRSGGLWRSTLVVASLLRELGTGRGRRGSGPLPGAAGVAKEAGEAGAEPEACGGGGGRGALPADDAAPKMRALLAEVESKEEDAGGRAERGGAEWRR